MRFFFLLGLTGLLWLGTLQPTVAQRTPRFSGADILDHVDEMPEYPGGQMELLRFLAKNVKYPPRALRLGITGKVYARFIVSSQGRVVRPTIMQGLTPECDSEVVRVLRLLPVFKPGREQGRPVNVYFMVPVAFLLDDDAPAGWQMPVRFTALLKAAGLTFRYPDSMMIETSVIANNQQRYQYALRHRTRRFEVRYFIRPLDSLVHAYRAFQQNPEPGIEKLDPNQWHVKEFQHAVLSNISGGRPQKMHDFPPAALKGEFGADWGTVTVVPLAAEFGQDYSFCSVVGMHKTDKADVYMFFLADSQEDMQEMLDPSFHALRFNPERPEPPKQTK